MSQIDGRWATFDNARALETDLSQAELGGASLVGADLRGANLAGVLWQPTPRSVDDKGQDRRYTVLQKVNMKDQDLSGHDLCECRIARSPFLYGSVRIPTVIYVAINRHLCHRWEARSVLAFAQHGRKSDENDQF